MKPSVQSGPESGVERPLGAGYPGILLMALWLALTAGLLEGAWRVFQRLGLHQVIRIPFDIVWMAPTIDFLWLLLPALLLVLARRIIPQTFSFAVTVGILGALGALPVLLLVTSMHKAVAILVAVGIGVQLSRVTATRGPGFARLIRRTLPMLGLAIATASGLVLGIERLNERSVSRRWAAASLDKPNVLLLVWDTVRNDELSVSGYSRPTTPFLESMAQAGARFEHAVSSAPWTLAAHGSLFTGQWPFEFFRGVRNPVVMHAPTVAELLSRAGYRTGGFTGNLAYTTREHGIHKGFQHYEDFSRSIGTALAWSRISWVLLDQQWVRHLIGYYDSTDRKRAADINASLLRWLDRDRSKPFFAFLNYFDAHSPYIAPSPFRERFASAPRGAYEIYPKPGLIKPSSRTAEEQAYWRAEYDALIASMDDATRELCSELADRGLLDKTVVIVTSDHGELFGEHGLSGHMNALYRPLLEVPLLIRYPTAVPGGLTIPTPVSLRDIPRTVLALTGVAADGVPGYSLTRFWRPEPAPADSVIFSELSVRRSRTIGPHAILLNGLYFIRTAPDSIELYDMVGDPEQLNSLLQDSTRRADLARFRQLSDSFAALYRRSGVPTR